MPKRHCENWLQTFLDWSAPVSEAPESLLIWSALFCISAVVKKKIDLDSYGETDQQGHLFKLEKKFRIAMHRWEIAFDAANGRMTRTEREYSRIAYAAYGEWQDELKISI